MTDSPAKTNTVSEPFTCRVYLSVRFLASRRNEVAVGIFELMMPGGDEYQTATMSICRAHKRSSRAYSVATKFQAPL